MFLKKIKIYQSFSKKSRWNKFKMVFLLSLIIYIFILMLPLNDYLRQIILSTPSALILSLGIHYIYSLGTSLRNITNNSDLQREFINWIKNTKLE